MSRLIVVSNRVSVVRGKAGPEGAGGLAVGVLDALKETGGIWFGWSGETPEKPSPTLHKVRGAGKITYLLADLARVDHEAYYGGFANSTLWPLFHYRLDLARFEADWYIAYRRVNQQFAEQLAPHIRDDDLVWIHDYHLLPLAGELRARGIKARLGFFLHIPFPAPEMFVALPWHRPLMSALCHCDVIGFQGHVDVRNFTEYLTREGMAGVQDPNTVIVGETGRPVHLNAYPIGIDVEAFRRLAVSAEVRKQVQRLRESLMGRRLLIGVDRLDYSKGIDERLRAFERLLQTYDEHVRDVMYLQISAPSREDVADYVDLRRQVEELSGRINGRYSTFDWVPLRYINKSVPRATLAGFFRLARVALVTPLRDGMNLVAKEFVAAQDPEDPGVLVLSRFAGAAGEMGDDAAMIVNPYDVQGVADTMHRALTLPLDERRARFEKMHVAVESHDIATWRSRFLEAMRAIPR